MTTTMIERVARAMCEDFLRVAFGEMGWDGNPPPNAEDVEREWREREWQEQKDMWMRAARVAIEAMREPTDAMIIRGGNAQTVNARANRGLYYRAMIDTALSEDKP